MSAEITVHEEHKRRAKRLRLRRDVINWTAAIIVVFLFRFTFKHLLGWIETTALWNKMPPRGRDLALGISIGALSVICLKLIVGDRSRPALRRWTGIVLAGGLSIYALVLLIEAAGFKF